jgi:hypothetical protein
MVDGLWLSIVEDAEMFFAQAGNVPSVGFFDCGIEDD